MSGVDYCLKLHTAAGKARLGYYRYDSLAAARDHAKDIVTNSAPLFEGPNPTVKVEVLAGRSTSPTEWFDTVVESYIRADPIRRPYITTLRFACAGMRY